jgi:hypothetical protein
LPSKRSLNAVWLPKLDRSFVHIGASKTASLGHGHDLPRRRVPRAY